MRITQERRRRNQGGNALIEAALSLSIFLIFLFSIYDFGWVMFYQQTLVHQARSGARYGAVNPGNLTDIQNMVVYSQTTGTGAGILGLVPANVSVTRNSPGTPEDRINVTISGYKYVLITMGWAGSYTGKPINVSIPVEN
jgi:Flp pilus assembly protein TadG